MDILKNVDNIKCKIINFQQIELKTNIQTTADTLHRDL